MSLHLVRALGFLQDSPSRGDAARPLSILRLMSGSRFPRQRLNSLEQQGTAEEVTARALSSIPSFYDYCSPEAPPSRSRAPPGGAHRSCWAALPRPHSFPGAKECPPPSAPPPGPARAPSSPRAGAPRPSLQPAGVPRAEPRGGRGQRAAAGARPGLVGFGVEEEEGVASAETKRFRGTGAGSASGARWRPGRLSRFARRRLATGRPLGARPRPCSASPGSRPPGHFSARPRPESRFHAVRVQHDAGKRVGVRDCGVGPGSVCGLAEVRSAESVELRVRDSEAPSPVPGRVAALSVGQCGSAAPNFAFGIETFRGLVLKVRSREPGSSPSL